MWHITEARKKISMARDVVKNWSWEQKGEMELAREAFVINRL